MREGKARRITRDRPKGVMAPSVSRIERVRYLSNRPAGGDAQTRREEESLADALTSASSA